MGWTIDQEKAIYTDTGTGNILVSAAAGSGKTAVLVERVLQKIISGKSTVDRLLIVTFTEAAASEMREKISERLLEYIESPECSVESKNLIKSQIRLIETADIMTIDAFCMRVVQNNFHSLGIDPDVRICDDGMAKLMTDEALDNMYDKIYKSDDTQVKERFDRLCDYYAKDRSNDGLSSMILSVYKFTEPLAEPVKWLEEAAESFEKPVLEWPAISYHERVSREVSEKCIIALDRITENESYDINVKNTALIVKKMAGEIYNAKDWDGIFEVVDKNLRTPQKRNKLLAIIKDLQGEGKNELLFAVSEFCDAFSGKDVPCAITQSAQQMSEQFNRTLLKEEAQDIAWIVKEFMSAFSDVKEKHKIYEFSDIEHLTYTLFRDSEPVREAYKAKYDEILIDEYQDTNMLQDTIFELISHNNIFMVGDLKQSIYRFRKGDPYIFKSKSDEYSKADSPHTRITLSQNFRSRQEILSGVNDIFSRIMTENAGDVDYVGGELIVRDSKYEYYPESNIDTKSELHYIPVIRETGIDKDEIEAKFTAEKIRDLLESGAKVYDKTLKKMRPVRKKDIVILENSVKHNAELLTAELAKLGIDTYVDKSSFFDRREISIMLSLISVINNSHQDIPLISVMRSPIGGFTDNDLSLIRMNDKKAPDFISAVRTYASDGERKALAGRCREFVRSIDRWRGYTRKKSVSQLIWTIYEETYFYDMMGAIEEGEEAQTNLKLLFERAKQYESAGFKGLFNFIKYIGELEKNESELVGAKLIGESHDVVRIMTIHKSKGLEFPFVFLLGMGKMFPPDSEFSKIQLHKNYGMGLAHIYYDKHYSQQTHTYELISKINRAESVSERMRLLYVALTRAREKLFVVVCQKAKAELRESELFHSWKGKIIGDFMPAKEVLSAKGFYDWLCPTAMMSEENWDLTCYFSQFSWEVYNNSEAEKPLGFADSAELGETVYRILDYEYPFKEGNEIPTRTSVTQLKEMSIEKDSEVYEPDSRRSSGTGDIAELMFSPLHQKPMFMQESGKKRANEIGTLYHLVMSEIDFNDISKNGTDWVDNELSRLVTENVISESDMEYIESEKIKTFFGSDIAKRMLASCEINRESPFQINISALEYDASLPQEYKDESVILQGIIDCYFDEGDGFVLVDYKTDKVIDGKEIREKYEKQLELYKKAIEKLRGKPVKESYLYLFDTGEVI